MNRETLVKNIVEKIDGGVFVEIGTDRGAFADHILQYSPNSTLYCVDPYISYSDYKDAINNVTGDALYEKTSSYLKSKYGNRIIFVRKFSELAIEDIPDKIDFLYIDGNHSCPYVLKDLELYYPRLKEGCYVIGDDAVDIDDEKRDEYGDIRIDWSPGCYGNYGVVKAFRTFCSKYNLQGSIQAENQYVIQKNSSLCYVTAFLDIQRENWSTFRRTFDQYFSAFTPLIDMFRKLENNSVYHLVVFADKKHSDTIKRYVNSLQNVTIVDIDEEYLQNNSTLWKRLQREAEIMNSDMYKELVQHRLSFPENTNPRYTLINHAKIDFVNLAAKLVPDRYFCWVDFGYFSNPKNIPKNPLDINIFDTSKINYTLINPLDNFDTDVFYTLQNAPEKIGGFFFFGSRESMAEYQILYHLVHESFQKNNIADDDQHVALQCYFANPALFVLHRVGGWHKALVAFQKTN